MKRGVVFGGARLSLRSESHSIEFGAADALGIGKAIGRENRRDEARAGRKFVVGIETRAIAEKRRAAHRFDTPGQHVRRFAACDLRDRLTDRRQPRRAIIVDAVRRHRVGQARMQLRHQGDMPALRAGLRDAAEDQRIGCRRDVATTHRERRRLLAHQLLRAQSGKPSIGPRLAARRPHGIV